MRKDKQKALRLRKTGKSYNEIKELLGIPKSTLSYWLKDIKWSTIIKDDLSRAITEKSIIRLRQLNSIRGRHLSKLYLEAQSEARDEFELFKFHPTFISGISIYWGEGDKLTRHLIRMGNIDPRMIKLFIKFLVEVCGVSRGKIRAHLLLYPDLDKKLCRSFWIKKLAYQIIILTRI
jgi:hypothetical protein